MHNKNIKSISQLAVLYDVSTKTISKEFKKIVYINQGKPAPKKLGIIAPKHILFFYEKYGKPDSVN
jgi:hypothetical protein